MIKRGNPKRAKKLLSSCNVLKLSPQEAEEFYETWRSVEQTGSITKEKADWLEGVVQKVGTRKFS